MKTTIRLAPLSAAVALVIVGAVATATADTVVFQPTLAHNNYHDAFLLGDQPTTAESGAAYEYIMNLAPIGDVYNFAVQFDGLNGYIGGHDAVTSAVLSLQFYFAPYLDPTESPSLDVHTLSESWANGATWFSRGNGTNWTNPGGTFSATPVASMTPDTNPTPYFTTFNWDVTTAVSNWVAGSSPDYGFLVKWSDSVTGYKGYFIQSSGIAALLPSFAGFEPKLTIYTIPEPSALLVANLTAIGAFIALRFGRR